MGEKRIEFVIEGEKTEPEEKPQRVTLDLHRGSVDNPNSVTLVAYNETGNRWPITTLYEDGTRGDWLCPGILRPQDFGFQNDGTGRIKQR